MELVIAAMFLLLAINVAAKATEADDAVTVSLKVREGQLLSEAFLHISDYDRRLVLPEGLHVGSGLVFMVRGPAPQEITLTLSVSDFPDEGITYQVTGSESNSQVLEMGGSVSLTILFEEVGDYGLILCKRSENGVLIPFDGMLPDVQQEAINNPRSNPKDRDDLNPSPEGDDRNNVVGGALDVDDVRHRNRDRFYHALYSLVDPHSQPLLIEGIHEEEGEAKLIESIIDPSSPYLKTMGYPLMGYPMFFRGIALDDFESPAGTIYSLFDRLSVTIVASDGPQNRNGPITLSMTPGVQWFAFVRLGSEDGPKLIRKGADKPEPTVRYDMPRDRGLTVPHIWGIFIDGMSDDNKKELSTSPPAMLKTRGLTLAPDGWPYGVGFWGEHEVRDLVHLWNVQQDQNVTYPLPASIITAMTTEFGRRIAKLLASEAQSVHDHNQKPIPLGQVLQDAVLAEYQAVEDEEQKHHHPFSTIGDVLREYRLLSVPGHEHE